MARMERDTGLLETIFYGAGFGALGSRPRASPICSWRGR
jgi:hypothetical protein